MHVFMETITGKKRSFAKIVEKHHKKTMGGDCCRLSTQLNGPMVGFDSWD